MIPKHKVAERSVTPIITLTEVRAQLNLFGDMSFDDELTIMIDVAQQNVEDYIGEYLGETTVVQPLSTFSEYNYNNPLPARRGSALGVRLTHRHITGIDSITYKSTDGSTKTVDASTYIFDDTGEDKYVRIRNGNSWPGDLDTTNYSYPVQITYTAQWENAPLPIAQAIYMTVAELFKNREVSDTRRHTEVPIGVKYLLANYVRM